MYERDFNSDSTCFQVYLSMIIMMMIKINRVESDPWQNQYLKHYLTKPGFFEGVKGKQELIIRLLMNYVNSLVIYHRLISSSVLRALVS